MPGKYCVEDTLRTNQYQPLEVMAKTLQGSVYKSSKNEATFAIKITSKALHHSRVTYQHSRAISIKEDIIKETQILKYLTHGPEPSQPPHAIHPSCIKYVDFFEDGHNYFLVMDHKGDSLFNFVKQCHEFVQKGFITLPVWHSFVKRALKQITSLIDWLHNTMHVCHLDVSLENFVIQNINLSFDESTQMILNFERFEIHIIDFGVAEMFPNDFKCSKHVGKTLYKAPEIYDRAESFDARSADCWSLGVCLFMMVVGSPPFPRASSDDALFKAIVMNHALDRVLEAWGKADYVSLDLLDLFGRLLCVNPERRLNIKEVAQHSFFR
eukprot:231698_1